MQIPGLHAENQRSYVALDKHLPASMYIQTYVYLSVRVCMCMWLLSIGKYPDKKREAHMQTGE